MNNINRRAAILAIGLFLALGAVNAAPAGAQLLDPGHGGASFASSISKRPDARLQRVAGPVSGAVEPLFGKIRQRLSAY